MDILGLRKVTQASDGSTDIAVASTGTVYTDSMFIGTAKFFALSYKANSVAGAIKLKIEIEQSFQKPTTEGSSDSYWSEPESMQDVVGALETENTIYHKGIAPIPLPYIRLKITGLTGNNADTILNAWIHAQEAS